MRLVDPRGHPLDHSALTNVLPGQHHKKPTIQAVANTTLSVSPLPGGPGQWDIAMDFDAVAVEFSFTSNNVIAEGGAKAGLYGVATRNQLHTSCISLGGFTTASITAYAAIYSKVASALNLSHKIWTTSGQYISLTNAYLAQTGPSTRVFRTEWTNYGASYYTLWCKGYVQVYF